MESPFFELLLGGSTTGTVCFWHCSSLQDGVIVWDLEVRFAAGWVGCCRSWLGYIEFLQLLIHIVLSPDVLCCSFVYLDMLLRSHAFSPKRLELVLKVVVWCFFLPSGLCPFPVSMSCCPGNSWELWGVRGSCFCWFSSALICTQNKLQILRVKPGISRG